MFPIRRGLPPSVGSVLFGPSFGTAVCVYAREHFFTIGEKCAVRADSVRPWARPEMLSRLCKNPIWAGPRTRKPLV